MHPQVDKQLLALLLTIYNKEVKDFYYFPEVVLVGKLRLEPEALQRLVNEGWLQPVKADSFGRYYQHTLKTEQLLMAHRSKRRPAIRVNKTSRQQQPLLEFTAPN